MLKYFLEHREELWATVPRRTHRCPAEREFRAGHTGDAVSLPVGVLSSRSGRVPNDRQVARTAADPYSVFADDAVRTLLRRGYRAARLEDGYPNGLAQDCRSRPTCTAQRQHRQPAAEPTGTVAVRVADPRMTRPGRTYRAAPRAPVGRRPSTRIGNSQVVAP
jgi:hypothetical protein